MGFELFDNIAWDNCLALNKKQAHCSNYIITRIFFIKIFGQVPAKIKDILMQIINNICHYTENAEVKNSTEVVCCMTSHQ